MEVSSLSSPPPTKCQILPASLLTPTQKATERFAEFFPAHINIRHTLRRRLKRLKNVDIDTNVNVKGRLPINHTVVSLVKRPNGSPANFARLNAP